MSAPQLALVFVLSWGIPQASPPVNRDAQLQKEFMDRAAKYVELRKAVEGKLPRLPDKAEPAVITAHQRALLAGLQRARSEARQGDLFRDQTRHLIRRLIVGALSEHGSRSREAIGEENPGTLPIRVNGQYPTSAPLPSVPPQVLLALPRLPDEGLEYRFVGRRLLLLDSRANMVVDYMDRALPN